MTTHLTVLENGRRTSAENADKRFFALFYKEKSAFGRVFTRPIPKCQVAR
jgi:hypothetical protein